MEAIGEVGRYEKVLQMYWGKGCWMHHYSKIMNHKYAPYM